MWTSLIVVLFYFPFYLVISAPILNRFKQGYLRCRAAPIERGLNNHEVHPSTPDYLPQWLAYRFAAIIVLRMFV